MKNWKRILAAVGTAALLASNLGAVTQTVFAENDISEEIPDEAEESTEEPAVEPEVEAEGGEEQPVEEVTEVKEPEVPAEETQSEQPAEPTEEYKGEEPEVPAEEVKPEEAGNTTSEPVEEVIVTPAEEVKTEDTVEEPAQYHESPMTAEDGGIAVQLVFDDAAQIPEDATLSLHRVDSDSDAYQEYYANVQEALDAEDAAITHADFVEIALEDADGEDVTPAAAVKATVTYDDSITVPVGTKVSVVRGDDVLSGSVDSDSDDDNTTVKAVTFDLSENDVYGIVGVEASTEEPLVDTSLEAQATDGASVKISGMLPADAEVTMNPVTYSDEELREYFGNDFVDGINTIGLYDITIWLDGEEWEPNDTVSVVISNPVVKPVNGDEENTLEATDEENIVVAHLQEDAESGEKTAETLETENIGDDVAFDTESFSVYGAFTYTVDYYYNDNEYHQAGGTTMTLSDLFGRLEIEQSAADATEVTFSNYDLIQIEQIENDWNLVSVAPFNTDEELLVTFSDGTQISILTQDAQYFRYTHSDNLTPYTGTYTAVGKYDIFGGGNGIAVVTSAQSGSINGAWGKTHYYSNIKGYTVTEHGSSSKDAWSSQFVASSVANITWDKTETFGDDAKEKGFFSFGYYGNTNSSGNIKVEISGPNNASADFTIYLGQSMTDDRDTDGRTFDWKFLSFDATDLLKVGGKGDYTVKVTVSSFGDSNYIADMGWSMYGVVANDALDNDAAALVYITEKNVLPSKAAEGTFDQSIFVNQSGKGKAWFNVHGGESGEADYLKIHVKDTSGTGASNYIKLGKSSSRYESTINLKSILTGSEFDADDIAQPNNEQTATVSYTKFSNRFAFGLGTFEDTDLAGMEVLGIQKSISSGADTLGSMMLWTEIEKAAGKVDYVNNIKVNNGTTIPAAETFTYTLEAIDDTTVYPTTGNTYSMTFTPDETETVKSKDGSIDFEFKQAGTFKYKLTQNQGSTYGWTYSAAEYKVTFVVEYDATTQKYKITSQTITDGDGNTVDDCVFENVYTNIVKTGVDLGSNGFVTLVLTMDAIVAAALIYGYAKRRVY